MVDEHSEAHTDGHPEGARPAGDAAAAPPARPAQSYGADNITVLEGLEAVR